MEIRDLATPLYAAKGWIKLVAVLYIVSGALTALTIVGIIIAWLPIWLGVLLFQCTGQLEQAYLSDNAQALQMALAKLKTYFTIMGVMLLVYLVFAGLFMIFGITTALVGAANM